MTEITAAGFPGGSRGKVNRAGENVRAGNATPDDLQRIEEWRGAHRAVLNTFQAILRFRTRQSNVTVAQRHKRKRTIFDKLNRIPGMRLARMDDIAGCRLIFDDIAQLYEFRDRFHKAKFKHKRRNDIDKYDYIKAPKETGYRGVHDVYEYDVNSDVGARLAGLYVEIQYRTLLQHAWSTAVEIVGFISESQPKFQQGDTRYTHEMALASEILARAFENSTGPFPNLDDRELVQQFLAIDKDLSLLKSLGGLNAADKSVSENRNTILIFPLKGDVETRDYRDATEALRALFDLEKQYPDQDIVLVKADTSDEVRLAFKNYFSDATDFIEFVERGCTLLSHTKRLNDMF